MQADKEEDVYHIDYIIPADDPAKKRQYTQFIARECQLSGLRLHGPHAEEWRSILRSSVSMERYIAFLEQVRKWHEMGRDTVPLVEVIELLIPCILHLENRIGEKIVTIILRMGLDVYRGRKKDYITMMENVFHTKVLGTEEAPSQWRLYYEKDSNGNIALEAIQECNNVSRCIIQEIDAIIEVAVPDHSTKSSLIAAISKYKEAMELLTLHRELTNDE
jgi:hypothetical protein